MPSPTYVAIAKTVLTGSQPTVTFSSIPSTYTDLLLVLSARGDSASTTDRLKVTFNGASTNFSNTYLYMNGTTPTSGTASGSNTYIQLWTIVDGGSTANTFGNAEIYIPNYASSNNKVASITATAETNAATNNSVGITAGLWSNTSAITSITLSVIFSTNFVSGSRFDLYGIKNV